MGNPRRQQLEDLALAGPHRLPPGSESELVAAATALGWPVTCHRPADARNTEAWLAALGQALGLPAHFGANFDALYDCLTDPGVMAAPGHLLILGNLACLGEEVDILIAVLQAASDEWRDQGRALWPLLDDPRLDLDPLPRV
ncbi:barstar family protein [Azovibrio restrictus]|uniref:barstar family protein n=1 Tax=Azovibrio restrictus TaxID=146938 RepID=UPI0026EC1FD3|nr:barstar family protein [Azovibrio restrictus]